MDLAYQSSARESLKAQLLASYTSCNNMRDLDVYAIDALDSDPCDYVAYYCLLSGQFRRFAKHDYILRNDLDSALENYSLSLLCYLKAIHYFENGYLTSNNAIERELCYKDKYSMYGYIAIMVGDMTSAQKFFPENTIVGCFIRKTYIPIKKMVSNLEDVHRIPINFCVSYEDEYFKQILLAMITNNEFVFNDAIAERITLCRTAPADYSVPIDVAVVALAKIAQNMGLSYNLNVIEIPNSLLSASIAPNHLLERLIPDLDRISARDDLCITKLMFSAKYRNLPYTAKIESVRRVGEKELYLVIYGDDREIYRRLVLTDKPKYVHLNYMLGYLKWKKKTTITLISKNKNESIEINIPDLSINNN